MASKGALGTTFAVSSKKPAGVSDTTVTATLESLVSDYREPDFGWQECAEVVSADGFGGEHEMVRIRKISGRTVLKRKGVRDNGSARLDLLFSSEDLGQFSLESAFDVDSASSFRIKFPGGPDAEEFYFRAYVSSMRKIVGGADDALMARCVLEFDHTPVVAWPGDA